MYARILLITLSVAAFSSCSTAYKSGQTPDDVYYSPVKYVDEKQNNNQDEAKKEDKQDVTIRMSTRDRRWREFDDDYRYNNSPYHYCTCNCNNNGYYYNPYYSPWPLYSTYTTPVNKTPRTANLNTYNNTNSRPAVDPKTGSVTNTRTASTQYNNSNRSGLGNLLREVFSPSPRNPSSPSSSSSNNTRTYTPASSGTNSSSSSSGSSSGTVTRPARGG